MPSLSRSSTRSIAIAFSFSAKPPISTSEAGLSFDHFNPRASSKQASVSARLSLITFLGISSSRTKKKIRPRGLNRSEPRSEHTPGPRFSPTRRLQLCDQEGSRNDRNRRFEQGRGSRDPDPGDDCSADERHLVAMAQSATMRIFPREQQTPKALGAFQKAEIEKWWPIIKEAGIKPE